MAEVKSVSPQRACFDIPPEVWEQIPEVVRWCVKLWRGVRFLLRLLDGNGRWILLIDLSRSRPRPKALRVSRNSSIWELARSRRVLYFRAFAPTISVGQEPSEG